VTEGERFTLGPYVIPDVSVWAFEARPGETSPVIDASSGYYVFRLDSVTAAGVPPLKQIRDRVSALVRLERQKTLAQHRADSLATLLQGTSDLVAAASAHALQAERFGPFTRIRPPSYLAREPVAVGAAFGLKVGERSGALQGESGYFIIQSLQRKPADSTAWLAQRDVQRTQFRQAAMQARMQQYMEDVRAQAKIVDRRKDIFKSQAAADATTGSL